MQVLLSVNTDVEAVEIEPAASWIHGHIAVTIELKTETISLKLSPRIREAA